MKQARSNEVAGASAAVQAMKGGQQTWNRFSILIFFGMVSLLWLAGPARAGVVRPDLASRIDRSAPGDEIPVIITLRDQLDLEQVPGGGRKAHRAELTSALQEKAGRTQNSLKRFLQQHTAGEIISYWIFNGMAATVRADLIGDLAALPEVSSVQLDGVITLQQPEPASTAAPEWNLGAIRAPELWNIGYTGTGVVVAGMDSGVDADHPDLAARWRGGGNSWYDPNGEHYAPYDSDGHGTRTMGLMVGGDAGGSAVGVAPGAQWIAVKIFNDHGEASYSAIHLGFQWLLDPDGDPATDDLPDVVNNSWGFDQAVDQCLPEFQPDVQALRAAGVAVVFAAGNTGPNPTTSISPANYPESFAVGAVDEALAIADFSGRGPSACDGGTYPDLVAPGVNIKAPDLTFGGTVPDAYAFAYVSGTSFAAPHVAGSMALMLSVDPLLTVDELEAVLAQSAADPGDPGADSAYGYGLLDVSAAYDRFTTFPLQVSLLGIRGGSVASDPPGINCPADCQGEYVEGRVVTLTAVPAANSTFTGWSGDCSGKETTCRVTVDRVKNVSAGFYSFPWNFFLPALTGHNKL